MGLETSVLSHLPDGSAEARGVAAPLERMYANVLLYPDFRSAIRGVTASNTASALYSDSREGHHAARS